MDREKEISKPRQRDNYIDKSKFQEAGDSNSNPKPRKMLKREVNKNQKRQDMVSRLNTENPTFSDLCLSPLQPFLETQERVLCKCNRRIKFYCPKCSATNTQLKFPEVKLALNITVLHHPEEKEAKSTGIPLKFLSPEINVLSFHEDLEEFPEGTFVLYPHKDSILVKELTETPKLVVAVDCTWYQTNSVLKVLERQKLRYIRLQGYDTHFWRYQHHGSQTLSTAQAIYFFTKEYYRDYLKLEHSPHLDNLLFLFVLNYHLISNYHKDKPEKIKD